MKIRRITEHAIQQYCLRAYKDVNYYLTRPEIVGELRQRILAAEECKTDPRRFFSGRNCLGARDVQLFKDDKLIYAVRDNQLITLFPAPGKDPLNDMMRKAFRRDKD